MQRGIAWVRGSVLENTTQRMTLTWNIGMQPIGADWPGAASTVEMRMTRLPSGKILITGVPSLTAYGNSVQYRGRAVCAE